jgi:hypothetical protein
LMYQLIIGRKTGSIVTHHPETIAVP